MTIIEFTVAQLVIIWLIGAILIKLLMKDMKRTMVSCLFWGYILLLSKITFFPILPLGPWKLFDCIKYSVVYIPFKDIASEITSASWYLQIIGNIMLFIPFSIFIGYFLTERGKYSRKKTVILVFWVSCIVEMVQLLINIVTEYPQRIISIDDIILNTLGGGLGLFVFEIGKLLLNKVRVKYKKIK